MKKLLPLLFLALCFSCSAQKVIQKPVYIVNAWVKESYSETTKLQPNDFRYDIAIPLDSTLLQGKEYTFYLEITDCKNCKTIQAVVIDYSLTTLQIQRDLENINNELSKRTKIKLKR